MAVTKNNRTLAILDAATAGKYGVMAAIAYETYPTAPFTELTCPSYNIEQLTALVRAAEAKRSPLIIQLFPSTLKQLPLLAHAAAHAVKTATVPLSLHIDHAQNVEHIREIIATLPVDSVMVDMSHYDEAENLEKTKILTKECHDRGIAVEAESGRIEGGEDGIADTGDLEGILQYAQDHRTTVNRVQRSLHHPMTLITLSTPELISSPLRLATFTATMVQQDPKKVNYIMTASRPSTSRSTNASSSHYTARMTFPPRSCSDAYAPALSS